MNKHSFVLENVVVGYSLRAVQYAFHNEYPLILNSDRAPFEFDTFSLDEKITRENEAWSLMLFEHGMKGLVPFGSGPTVVSITGGNNMKISARDSFTVLASFDKCYVFEDDFVTSENNIVSSPSELRYRVIDWIDVRTGSEHDVEVLGSESDFVNEVYFYPSYRIDGNHDKKDCVAVSYLTESQLSDFEYSDTMVKFKVRSMMSEAGVTGAKKGVDSKNVQKTSKIKLEPRSRDVQLLTRTVYENTKNVIYVRAKPLK